MSINEENKDQKQEKTLDIPSKKLNKEILLDGMYQNWFLDYASYVILERAVPSLSDGLKPVQRRILHAMKEMDDGRYNKVANIIGQTMKYHPHGDASIGDALVQLGQKDILIDMQGNWGNIYTGDRAAAPRYIEARLSPFAKEVLFNAKTTEWQASYDGRNREPVNLPVKFPLLLLLGIEGIAVGLASKILSHNFNELIDASIDYLKGKEPNLLPDFPTGGMADFSKYNEGIRGGKVRVRAKIEKQENKALIIKEIPHETTTTSLIESIIAANDKGKIKIRKIEDNTAEHVEIVIYLLPGTNPDQTIDALYAFTDCEKSISPNCCVIDNDKPRFVGVNEILKDSTNNTVDLLKLELEIRKHELMEQHLFSSLEKIFIEKKIYRDIEECETWDEILVSIDKGLTPYKKLFYREIKQEDIIKLTEIKIKRISKFDSFKADEIIKGIEDEIKNVTFNLENLVDYAILYFKEIKKKYGKGRERKTEIRNFDTIEATQVAAYNVKLYVNRTEGFAGFGLKNDEYICDCSDLDEIIAFREDGKFIISKIEEKAFVGKNIIHINVFRRNDERTIYNAIYKDGIRGHVYMKRFAVTSFQRDKEYDVTKGSEGSKILYFTANPNGEAEIITIHLKHRPRLKKLKFDIDFSELAIKGRNAIGNIVTKYQLRKIELKEKGIPTLGGIDIWFDDNVKRLNTEGKGKYLGAFNEGDKILSLMKSGTFKLSSFDTSTYFDDDMIEIEKFSAKRIITAVYTDPETKLHYIKRFKIESNESYADFIDSSEGAKLISYSFDKYPLLKINLDTHGNRNQISSEEIDVHDFIGIKGVKAKGKRLSNKDIKKLEWLEPIPEDQKQNVEDESGDTAEFNEQMLSEEEKQIELNFFNEKNGKE